MALAYMGLKPTTSGGKLADSADPMWLDRESPPPTAPIVSHDTGAPSNGQVRESSTLSHCKACHNFSCWRPQHILSLKRQWLTFSRCVSIRSAVPQREGRRLSNCSSELAVHQNAA